MKRQGTLLDQIIKCEAQELEQEEILELFSELIKTKQNWALWSGKYKQYAKYLQRKKVIDKEGNINWDLWAEKYMDRKFVW